ncbi:MAG: hypothetical protein R3F65_09435 [bacterium]
MDAEEGGEEVDGLGGVAAAEGAFDGDAAAGVDDDAFDFGDGGGDEGGGEGALAVAGEGGGGEGVGVGMGRVRWVRWWVRMGGG